MLPNDPMILLSVVNTWLRDEYPSLVELCAAEGTSPEALAEKLAAVGFRYDPQRNQFC